MSEFDSSAEPVDEAAVLSTDVISEVAATTSPVAESMSELDGLGQLEVSEHPAVYQRIHSELQSALSSIDDA